MTHLTQHALTARRIVRDVGGGACPSCGTENPERARFCMSCGAALSATCPSVRRPRTRPARSSASSAGRASGRVDRAWRRLRRAQAPAAPDPRSGGAGTPPRPSAGGAVRRPAPGGRRAGLGLAARALPEERRKATVLFADLSGYTAVAERMDPEAVKSIVDRALRRLGAGGRPLRRHGRQVHRRQRDGACSARRSPTRTTPSAPSAPGSRCRPRWRRSTSDIAAAAGVSFSLRVGINSGEVLAGQVGDGYTVIGDAVNVAARLQARGRARAASPSARSPTA